ncbi:MAG: hypothetical protein DMG03_17645 [Acidobacteria bacterium]|nr:MAG: hypothetical protein DMG03_17645 [Acidobacteriota bacterium]
MDARPDGAARAGRARLAVERGNRFRRPAAPAADGATRARATEDWVVFHQRPAGIDACDAAARASEPRYSRGRTVVPRDRLLRAADRRRRRSDPAARALSRARGARAGRGAGRRNAIAHLDQQLGFQLAGSISLRVTGPFAGRNANHDRVRLRQLRRQRAQSTAPGRSLADVWLQVTTRSNADRERLAADIRRKMATEDAIGCEALIAREPAHVNLRNDAAVLYLELGRPDRALEHFEAVRRLQPESAAAHYNVGVALEALGRADDATRAYDAAVRYNPRHSAAHNNLGNMLLAAGRVPDARDHYQRAVAAGPDNAEAHNNLGGVLVALGEIDEAIRLLQRALQLRPVYAEAHFNLARAFAAAGRRDEATHAGAIAKKEATAAEKTRLAGQIDDLLRSLGR